jgi:pimeloyl-ACP methyl ester carboxylesterase
MWQLDLRAVALTGHGSPLDLGIGLGMSGPRGRWLLLHGAPLTPQVWDGVAGHLREYGSVWCPDVSPAAGGTDAQATLAARLASAAGTFPQRLHVAGHSFGGQVAIDFALLAPERVQTLTVVCSRDTPFPPFAAAAGRLRHGDPVDTRAVLGRWFTAAELAAGGPVVVYARHRLHHAGRASWAAALDAIAGYDRAGRAGSISVPCTLITAELDQVATPAAMSALASRLPQATLHILAGAAHMTPFTDSARLAMLLTRAARS